MFWYVVLFYVFFFFFNDTATTEIYTLSLHDALPIFRRPRLTGHLRESQRKGLGKPSPAHGVNANRLLFRTTLQNHSVEFLNPPRDFRLRTQHVVELFYFLVKCSSMFEVQLLAGFFALLFESGAQGPATRFQKVHQPVHFHVIFFLCTSRKARREAHLHLGIKTTGEGGVAPDLNLAAPHFEKIERAFGERLRGAPRCKWTVVCAARGHARFVNRNPASHITPRIGVPEIHLQHRGWPQAHQVAV